MGNLAVKIAHKMKLLGRSSDCFLASGERAAHSGIYQLEHQSHNAEEEIFIRNGTKLPFCPRCTRPIRFRLIKKLPYIAEDPDFQ